MVSGQIVFYPRQGQCCKAEHLVFSCLASRQLVYMGQVWFASDKWRKLCEWSVTVSLLTLRRHPYYKTFPKEDRPFKQFLLTKAKPVGIYDRKLIDEIMANHAKAISKERNN